MFDYVAFVLLLIYGSLFVMGGYQIHKTFESRNKRLTIRNGIVTILTSASLLRIIFWLKACIPTTISSQAGLIVFFLPVWLNFCGLSLLVVFYAQAVSSSPTLLPMRICILANTALLIANLVIAGELDSPDTSTYFKANMFIAYSVYGSLLDFTLALMLLYYGYRFKTASSRNVLTTRILPNSLRIFDAVNWIIIAAYMFRGTFSAILSSGKVLPKDGGGVEFNGDHPVTSVTTFVFFFVAELIPCACVLGMLWKVAHGQVKYGIQHHIDSLARGEGVDSTLDARLLSVEDSKVKIFINKENKTASLDEEEETHHYLLFEETHQMGRQYQQAASDAEQAEELSIPGPLPIPRRPSPNLPPSPLTQSSFDPSPSPSSGSFSKFWGMGTFAKPPVSTPSPDLLPYGEQQEGGSDGGGGGFRSDSGGEGRGSEAETAEKYANTLSPRDILLHAERRRSLGKK